MQNATIAEKVRWNLPWLVKYPFDRIKNYFERRHAEKTHIVFTIADHFEPSWSPNGHLPVDEQRRALDRYHKLARQTGERLVDSDGKKFGHTFFYPAEQYHADLVDKIAEMQSEGLGELEVHLHHGIEEPDTARNLRDQLLEFRDCAAEEHRCLSRFEGEGEPKYAFVHGNLALGNSANGNYCGVDEEMQILADTGCYVDMTLASAPDLSQVPMINQIYECAHPLDEAVPHRDGTNVEVNGETPQLPLIFHRTLSF